MDIFRNFFSSKNKCKCIPGSFSAFEPVISKERPSLVGVISEGDNIPEVMLSVMVMKSRAEHAILKPKAVEAA